MLELQKIRKISLALFEDFQGILQFSVHEQETAKIVAGHGLHLL